MFSFMGLMNGTTDTHTNVSCTCNCKRSTSFQSMAISEYPSVFSLTFFTKRFESEGSLWSSDGPSSSSAMSEVYAPDRVPSYLQRERLPRFQPTFPYLPHAIIDLPPTISLSDGEEPPPYQGPCSLQLRDPEQQLELNRESVRAPPNRTVFDGPLISAPTIHCTFFFYAKNH
uniref:Prostate transmembrane protein, androgen induced 1 n=1 Tax=Sinocyclocheilus rhinocerous TaxID=307959 RepID=A0A673H141_9TELE